jgi:hypothetical protein
MNLVFRGAVVLAHHNRTNTYLVAYLYAARRHKSFARKKTDAKDALTHS